MGKSMNIQGIPQTDSIQELARFWDTHDLTDFEDQLEEVNEPVFEREEVLARTTMRIRVVPVPKSYLEAIPEAELAFYTHLGHVRNELLVIEKFLVWTMENQTDGDVLSDVNVFQELIILRLLAGKLHEGWQLLNNKTYSTIFESLRTGLDSKTRTTLKELDAYFGNKKNMIEMIRNRFAFHYDSSLIRKQLSSVEETDQLAIYIAPRTVNCFYQFSEVIANRAMLSAVKGADHIEALKMLTKEVIKVTVRFIGFSDGCLNHMIETYLLTDETELKTRMVEVDVLRREQMTLPFFVE